MKLAALWAILLTVGALVGFALIATIMGAM